KLIKVRQLSQWLPMSTVPGTITPVPLIVACWQQVCTGVGVGVGVAVGVPLKWHHVILVVSTRQPSLAPLLSLAIRQRRTALPSSGGSLTTVVINPPELPLQAGRPAMGLPVPVAMVELYPPATK